MTDTYNDTTGSRKKFLIPLVVLLLCAVSLTGAGYAYNTSVNVDQSADVDDYFVIDLYTFANPTEVETFADLNTNGIVFTTDKVISNTPTLNGKFELEALPDNEPVTIYKGAFKINTPTMDDTTTHASVKLDDLSAEFADGTVYKAADVVNGEIVVEMQVSTSSNFATLKEFNTDFDYNTPYFYRIVVTSISGTVTAKNNVDPACSDLTDKDARVFAQNVVDADKGLEIQFGFKLTAYNPNTFTVQYKDGEEQIGGVDLFTVGTAFNLTYVPTKEGYTFAGWYDNAGLTGEPVTAIAKDATAGAKTFYAKWTANTYEVEFDANGGDGEPMANQEFTYDAAATALTANSYTHATLAFQGWATEADGDVVYADEEAVGNLTAENGATVTLFAVWA